MNISERIDSLFMNNPLHEAGVFEHEHYDPEDPERKKWSAPEPKTEAELQKDAYDKQQKEMQDRWDAEEKAKAEEKELNKKKEEEEKKEQDELWAKEETERIKANREGLLNILTEFNNRGYDLNKYSKIYFIDKNNKKCRSLVADKIIFRPDAELPTDLKATNPLFSKGPGYKDIVTVSNKNELDSLGKEEDILYRVVDTKINYVYENGQLKVKNILPIKKVSLAEIKEVYCGDKDNKGSIKFELGPRGDHIVEFNFSSEDINSIYDKKYLSAAEDAIAKNAIEKDKKKFEVIEKKNEERIISAINVARNTYRHFPADLVTVENHVLKIKNGTEIKAYRTLQTYEIKFFAYEWVDDVSILKLRRYPYNFFENRPTASSNDETICIGYVRRKEQTPPADREGPKIPERKYEGEAIRFYSQAEHFPSKVDFPYRGRPGHMYVDDATGQKYIYDILSPTTKEKQAVWGFELTNEEEGWPKNPQLKTLYINESETGQFNKGQGYLWNAEQGFYKYDRPEKKQGTWDDKVRYPSINDFPGNAKIELNPEKYASKESYEKALEWARITDKEKRSNRVLYIDDSTGRGYIWDETRKGYTYVPKVEEEKLPRKYYMYIWAPTPDELPKKQPIEVITGPKSALHHFKVKTKTSNESTKGIDPQTIYAFKNRPTSDVWPAMIKKEDTILKSSKDIFDKVERGASIARLRFGDKYNSGKTIEVLDREIEKTGLDKEIVTKVLNGNLSANELDFLKKLYNHTEIPDAEDYKTDNVLNLFAKRIFAGLPVSVKNKIKESRMSVKNRINESIESDLIKEIEKVRLADKKDSEDILKLAHLIKEADFKQLTPSEAKAVAEFCEQCSGDATLSKITDYCQKKVIEALNESSVIVRKNRIREAEEDSEEVAIDSVDEDESEGIAIDDVEDEEEDIIPEEESSDPLVAVCKRIDQAEKPAKDDILELANLVKDIGMENMTNVQLCAMIDMFDGDHWDYEPLQKIRNYVLNVLEKRF